MRSVDMNTRLLGVLLVTVLLFVPALALAAVPQSPDYSREALLRIFGDFYAPPPASSPLQWDVPIAGSRVRLHYIPILLPLARGMFHGNPMPAVSPFELLNVSFPSTKAMVAIDDRNLKKAIRQIERRRDREAAYGR
jgi:hypothetical protein